MWKKVPKQGIPSEALLREAVTEFRAVIDAVRAAVAKKMFPFAPDRWVSLEVVYPTYTIAEDEAGKMYQFDYTIDATGNVTLGEPKQVVEQYVPVTEAVVPLVGDDVFIEAVGETNSGKWMIRVIKAGLSGNNNFYPDAVLKESVPLFENARVFIKSDAEHIKGDGKAVNNLIGRLTEAKFVAGSLPDTGEIDALLEFIEPDGAVSTKVREAYARGMKDLFGFSIDANAKVKKTTRNGVAVREATKFSKVLSVDLIVEPGAGGQLIRMVEAIEESPNDPHINQEQDMLKQRMLEAIKAKSPAAYALINQETITDDQLEAAYREAISTGTSDLTNNVRLLEAQVRMSNATATITASTLPQVAKDKLISDFAARESFDDKAVTDAITAEREYLGRFTESGKPVINFDEGARVQDKSVQMADMLDAFFDPAHIDHRAVGSFKECYIEITGDKRVTGRLENCDVSRMRESMGGSFRESIDSTGFANVLGNSITRRMIAEYNGAVDFQSWREIVTVTPVNDFRTQERTRFGGYGDLPIVGEKDPYAAMTSPSDEKATYALSKRGGTEDVTMEMIKNDDVGAIRRIPTKLGRSAARTLAKFSFDFVRTNPVIYDGITLFHASRGNLGSSALDATSLAGGRLSMLKQTEAGSNDRLGIGPKNLLVPVDMQEGAVNLFNRSTNNDKTFIQANTLNIIPVWYWTDVTDWALTADPRDIPTIEIGFLDGQEEPQLFVQDMPNMGSMFANDTLTYKIRHIYGGNVLDFRGMYKAVVAG